MKPPGPGAPPGTPALSARDGDTKGGVGVGANAITGSRTERQVHEVEERFRLLVEQVRDYAIFLLDTDGRVASWNVGAEKIKGYREEEILGKPMTVFYPPESIAAGLPQDLLHRAVEQGRVEHEGWRVRKDGTGFWADVTITALLDDAGRLRGFAKITRDLTERRRLLDELQRAEQSHRFLSAASKELAESLEYEATLAKITQLAVPTLADWCVVDLAEGGTIRRASIAHVDPAKVRLVEDLGRRYPPDPHAARGVASAIRTGATDWAADVDDALLVAVARDGDHLAILRELGLRSYISAPMLVHGRLIGVMTMVAAGPDRRYTEHDVGVAEELARRAAAAFENVRLHRESQESIRLRESILAIVSHDLRNPLGSIELSATLLMKRMPARGADERVRKQIESIQRASHRMERLIGDLLDMASIQAGRLSIEREQTDLIEVLNEAIEPAEPLARAEGIELRRELGTVSMLVHCDRQRIVQALSNLLGNAIKFCRSGESVVVSTECTETDVVVAVSDTGPGIRPDELPRLFEPYWTAKRHGKRGTGLGLYITKGIVEAHGGRIYVESTIGTGATFRLVLPLDR